LNFDRVSNELRIFKLEGGSYQLQTIDNSKFWIPELQLAIGLWLGQYRGLNRLWLRWYDQHGNWIPTDAELERQRAEQERQQKELAQQEAQQERQQKELAQQRAQQLAERLRQMGINPDEI
ncbi:MAG: Uma2 family endonuclease, partial [Moorea sp. SIO3H5]|nr:Uma2 family endonuclease [Moorena sp. SIO3H5]